MAWSNTPFTAWLASFNTLGDISTCLVVGRFTEVLKYCRILITVPIGQNVKIHNSQVQRAKCAKARFQ